MSEQSAPAKTGGTVTVACKLPNGLILRLFREEQHDEPVLGGGTKPVKQFRATGDSFRIHGNAVPHGKTPRHRIVLPGGAEGEEGAPFTDGYALTRGVPKDLWEQWLEQNRELPAVVNKLVFACATPEAAEARALNHMRTRSGLEPVNPDGDPRTPKKITRGDRKPETTAA